MPRRTPPPSRAPRWSGSDSVAVRRRDCRDSRWSGRVAGDAVEGVAYARARREFAQSNSTAESVIQHLIHIIVEGTTIALSHAIAGLPRTHVHVNAEHTMAEMDSLRELYVEELKDLWSAENQILKGLPRMIKAATHPQLKRAFTKHEQQTKQQVKRLEQICED